jgi:hypothetical protein
MLNRWFRVMVWFVPAIHGPLLKRRRKDVNAGVERRHDATR